MRDWAMGEAAIEELIATLEAWPGTCLRSPSRMRGRSGESPRPAVLGRDAGRRCD
jgi:hypothetical protein